jgi:hypothetical protein
MRTSLPFAASSPFSTSLSRWLGAGDGTRSMDRVPASGEDIELSSASFSVCRRRALRSVLLAAIVLTIAVICP